MMVLLLKQMHLQNDIAVDLAAVLRWSREKRRRVRVRLVEREGRIAMGGEFRELQIKLVKAVNEGMTVSAF